MSKGRKALGAIGLLFSALIVAFAITFLCATDDERTELLDIFIPGRQEEHASKQIDWDALPPEVIAWVEVPDTSIDEPIVQATPDAPNAYLYHDALGLGAYGTPYIDSECSLNADFVLVYGHHMSDGSVFADFANFIDEGYARSHSRIIVYKRSGERHELEAVAVDVVDASRERLHIPKSDDFRKRVESCDLVLGGEIANGQLWAFATCSYQTLNSRTIILAFDASSTLW